MLYDEIESWSEKFLMSQKFTMVGCHGFSSRNSDALAQKSSAAVGTKSKGLFKNGGK